MSDEPDFCPEGCYWDCGHRPPQPWTSRMEEMSARASDAIATERRDQAQRIRAMLDTIKFPAFSKNAIALVVEPDD